MCDGDAYGAESISFTSVRNLKIDGVNMQIMTVYFVSSLLQGLNMRWESQPAQLVAQHLTNPCQLRGRRRLGLQQ